MFPPTAMDDFRVEPSAVHQLLSIEQFFRPRPKRTLDPFPDRNCKSRLWPFYGLATNVTVKQLPKNMFALAVAYLELDGNPGSQCRQSMIQKWQPGFETHGHRGAVDFAEDVIGQIGNGIEIHHPERIGRGSPEIDVELAEVAHR